MAILNFGISRTLYYRKVRQNIERYKKIDKEDKLMKKSVALKVMTLAAGMLTFLATITTASACWFGMYQPEEPKLLREE